MRVFDGEVFENGFRAEHGIGLARSSLSISENGSIDTLEAKV